MGHITFEPIESQYNFKQIHIHNLIHYDSK